MKDFIWLLQNFFTHKDFLPAAEELPGTIFTPLHLWFSVILLFTVILAAWYVSGHRAWIRPIFIWVWAVMAIWEPVIILWDSLAGITPSFTWEESLSLYPCSIFLYAMPLLIWGKGLWREMACGYFCTLGMLGGFVNFFYPITRLVEYSCISFPGFHTFFYHSALLFVFFTLQFSGLHRYTGVKHPIQLLLPSVLSLLLSIPANIVNYLFEADYMYFRGKMGVVQAVFGNTQEGYVTLILYLLYILIPALFYLPSYLCNRFRSRNTQQQTEPIPEKTTV